MKRGYAGIGLYQPKTKENVGSALRAAVCFDAAFVAVYGQRYKRAATDTLKGYRHLPLFHSYCTSLLDTVPFDCVPVAIEITDTASSLHTYKHPERAFYIFGPEDGSVPSHVLAHCRDVIRIPGHFCLNLAAAVNIVLYDRFAKDLSS